MQMGGRNQSLGHYIGNLNSETIIIYHSKYSESPTLPMFALKALSRVVGSQPLHKGIEKIILVEKQEAIRIFGYMPGYVGSRAGYFRTMVSYVLAHVGKAEEIKKIQGYKKQEFLKYRGEIEWNVGAEDEEPVEEEPDEPSTSQIG